VLADDQPTWRPRSFGYGRSGCRLLFRFPTVKLLDFAARSDALEVDPNPFGLIVLAHLKALYTGPEDPDRFVWKMRLIRGLYERGLSAEDVRRLYYVIDCLMQLPPALDEIWQQELVEYERGKQMPYVTGIERRALERGRQEGRLEGVLEGIEWTLNQKFGAEGVALLSIIKSWNDLERLRAFRNTLITANRIDELRQFLAELPNG